MNKSKETNQIQTTFQRELRKLSEKLLAALIPSTKSEMRLTALQAEVVKDARAYLKLVTECTDAVLVEMIRKAALAEGKIYAIKLYREHTDASLLEAKNFVEAALKQGKGRQ